MLLFLKISLICLNVSHELDRLATYSFFSSFKRLDLLYTYLGYFYLEKMLFNIEKPPFDSDFGLAIALEDSLSKKG